MHAQLNFSVSEDALSFARKLFTGMGIFPKLLFQTTGSLDLIISVVRNFSGFTRRELALVAVIFVNFTSLGCGFR